MPHTSSLAITGAFLRLTTLILAVWSLPSMPGWAADATTAEWPQWRGPSGLGHASPNAQVPVRWDNEKNVRWKTPTDGRGWSSPIVVGKQIWLTTAIEIPAKEEDVERRLKSNTGGQPLTLLDQVELRALCIDRDSGQLLHELPLMTVREPQWVHKLNSYASPTPVYAAGKLYCHFGTFGTACIDTGSATVDWVHQELQVMHENGPGGSPILVDDLVVFHLDGSDRQFIAALHQGTGKVAWTTARSGEMHSNPQQKKSYGTPLLVDINGQPQIVSPASDWVYAYDPKTGRELWKVAYGQLGFSVVPRPIIGHGMLFIVTGFGKGQIIALRYEGLPTPEIVWQFNRGTPTMPSPILVGEELYFVSDNGVFTCLDALTGREIYRERLSGNFSSSLWLAGGNIYVSNREGITYVIRAGKEFELVAENSVPEGIYATPAVVNNAIYLRTENHLYRLEQLD